MFTISILLRWCLQALADVQSGCLPGSSATALFRFESGFFFSPAADPQRLGATGY